MERTVFLVGARASGKTTVGRELARLLDYQFIDTDQYVLEATSRTVASLVAAEGWDAFRKRESIALHTAAVPYTVVATGGGMILSELNRIFMREQGTVFYLCVPASVLSKRLVIDPETTQRPTLTGRSIVDEVHEVLALRAPLYRQTAHLVLDATAPVQTIVEQAQAFLNTKTVHRAMSRIQMND